MTKWSLKTGGLLIQVVTRTGFTVLLYVIYISISRLLASQLSDLEHQSEQVYTEGLASLRCGGESAEDESSTDEGVKPVSGSGSGGAGPDANMAALWECYFRWAVERYEQPVSYKSIKKKVKCTVWILCIRLVNCNSVFVYGSWLSVYVEVIAM